MRLRAGGAYFLGAERAWVPVSDTTPSSTFVVDRVLFTTDGGRTWRSSSPLPGLPPPSTVPLLGLSLSFLNDRVGYALASGSQVDSNGNNPLTTLLWQTLDGGRRWRAVNSASLPLAGLVGDTSFIDQSPTRCGYDGGSPSALSPRLTASSRPEPARQVPPACGKAPTGDGTGRLRRSWRHPGAGQQQLCPRPGCLSSPWERRSSA